MEEFVKKAFPWFALLAGVSLVWAGLFPLAGAYSGIVQAIVGIVTVAGAVMALM